jgi:bifunctional non-homologous end joining protein LigD
MPRQDAFAGLRDAERAALRDSGDAPPLGAMLATLTDERFSDPEWIFERKLDGIRCLAHRAADGRVRLLSRNDQDLSRAYPGVAEAVAGAASTDVILDGEVVAFRGRRTSFEQLQQAHETGVPVFYYVFDVLHLGGHDVRGLPLLTRKRLLRQAVRFADPLRYTTHRRAAGEQLYEAACKRGDEGVVAKRAAAGYTTGRSKDWLKFKCIRDQELVIGGWTEPQGSRTGFGALLLGYYEPGADGATFVYAGKVGTGFNDTILRDVGARLRKLGVEASPFGRGRIRERDVHWVRPELVAQIGFTEWTRDGLLRHPRFQGLRSDKSPDEVVREQR